jgi:hypothetical protein
MFENNTTKKQWRGLSVAILCTVMTAFTYLPKAAADDWDKKTVITFGETVQIPGQALPAGTYVFKLMNSASDRHVVQIFDQHERKLIATLLAVPDYREQPAKNAIRFEERLSTEPQAIKVWFRPGDLTGNEFLYSKNQSQLLARNSPWAVPGTTTTEVASAATAPAAPVVTEPSETTPAVETPSDNSSTAMPSPSTSDAEQAPEGPSPSAEETPDAGIPQDAAQQPAQSTDTTTTDKSDKLPKTGSELPLIGLLGSFSLGFGCLVSAYRRRFRQ